LTLANPDVLERAARVRLAVFDVDGVLTDGRLYVGPDGAELKAFSARDGHGLKLLQESGVAVAVLSGRAAPAVTARMSALGVTRIRQGREDKLAALDEMLAEVGVGREDACYVGDDVIDLPAIRCAGLGVAVADAHPLVRAHARWVTGLPGGGGAARELCELVMQAQGTLDAALAPWTAPASRPASR